MAKKTKAQILKEERAGKNEFEITYEARSLHNRVFTKVAYLWAKDAKEARTEFEENWQDHDSFEGFNEELIGSVEIKKIRKTNARP